MGSEWAMCGPEYGVEDGAGHGDSVTVVEALDEHVEAHDVSGYGPQLTSLSLIGFSGAEAGSTIASN